MTYESPWRFSGGSSGGRESSNIPDAPPLPTPRPLQRARDAATRFFGYQSRSASPHGSPEEDRDRYFSRGRARYASLSATQNATASHKTGLGINTIAINEKGTHALLGGKEIFRTVKVEDGAIATGFDLRSAIRSTPTSASGQARHKYTIDIADVAWARGDCGDYVAAATSSGKIILYDLGHAGIQAAQLHEHFRQVHKVTFNPHRGCLLLSGSQDGTVRLWDVRDVKSASTIHSKRKFSGQSDGVRDVKWSPTDGVDFAIGTDGGWILRWDIRNLNHPIIRVPAHSETCNSIDWHPDGKHIASASSDKTVKIWDLSTGKRQQKANWEIQTPHQVLNARWRPACESSVAGSQDARQCTQIVTNYDEEHPGVHIWDLRRPAMPFRELFPYSSAPTDLLWHSQDLLWTVGREGTFVQTDIQYAPKVLDKRNLQAFSTSTFGDLSFYTQKRPPRRIAPKQCAAIVMASKDSSRSGSPLRDAGLSRSWADDGLDQSFLQAGPARPDTQRLPQLSRHPSVGTTSSNELIVARVVPLDEVMASQGALRPRQLGFYGPLPYQLDPRLFAFMAKNYKFDVNAIPDDEGFLANFEQLLNHNAQVAQTAGLYRTAQTWRIASGVLLYHLKQRVELKLQRRAENKQLVRTSEERLTLVDIMRRLMAEANKSPMSSPPSMKPLSAITQQFARSDAASDQATPLIQPTANIAGILAEDQTLLELDEREEPAIPSSQLTSTNLHGLQQQQQNTVEAQKEAMVKRWSIQPREPLNLDPVDARGVKIRSPKLERHASNESFTFLDGSANSRDPSFPSSYESRGSPLEMVAERPSRVRGAAGKEPVTGGIESYDFDDRPQPEAVMEAKEAADDLHLGERIPVVAADKKDHKTTSVKGKVDLAPEARKAALYFPGDEDEDIEGDGPFAFVEMLRELVNYYAAAGDAQTATQLILSLAPMLPHTHPLPEAETTSTVAAYMDCFTNAGYTTEEVESILSTHLEGTIQSGLQPLQIEAILCTYHEQLVRRQLFNQAAILRRLAYPMYPSVYEDALANNHVHLKCGNCGKPLPTGTPRLRCENCHQKQDSCTYCCSDSSPYEEDGKKSRLMTTCLKCNHAFHAACMRNWFDEGIGACPTEGCLCDCMPGSWREEKAKMAEAEKREREREKEKGLGRVKSDDFVVKESEAAGKATAVLRDAGGKGRAQ